MALSFSGGETLKIVEAAFAYQHAARKVQLAERGLGSTQDLRDPGDDRPLETRRGDLAEAHKQLEDADSKLQQAVVSGDWDHEGVTPPAMIDKIKESTRGYLPVA